MPWLRTYVLICVAVLLGCLVALILVVSLVDLGLSSDGLVALFIGALATIALTMVLMGLVFRSSRDGSDGRAHGISSRQR